jgi:hypothetical protein
MKEFITDHIRSFPVIESHYCRASTSKQYLEGSLNITKMYNLYLERCRDDGKEPAKASLHRQIFFTQFNLSFHKPKSDRCPVCEKKGLQSKKTYRFNRVKGGIMKSTKSTIPIRLSVDLFSDLNCVLCLLFTLLRNNGR